MSDPFDVLRHEFGRTEPDAQFRARLMSEVSNALATLDPPVTATENQPLLELTAHRRRSTFRRRRTIASLLGIAAAIIGVLILLLGGTGDPNAVTTPLTTQPTTTTAARHLSDPEVAKAILLTPQEYAPDWVPVVWKKLTMDAALAARVPGCASYIGVAFENEARPAVVDTAWYQSRQGLQAGQYVVVLATEDAAKTMFAATVDPKFTSGCLPGYLNQVGSDCCNLAKETSPLWIGDSPAPTLALEGDEAALRATEVSWVDQFGHSHGPVQLLGATVRVGRAIVIITTITADEHGVPVVSTDQFKKAVATFVSHARKAMASAAAS